MTDSLKPKRPASHRWAIGILAFMTAAFIVLLIDLFSGRSGANPQPYWIPLAVLAFGAVGLAALVLGRRQQSPYYVAAGSLGIWACRGVYTMSVRAYHLLFSGGSFSTPYFHLAERDKPFVVQQHESLGRQFLMAVALGLFIWLFIRFTFGRPSRSYYGFCDAEKIDAG